jgi:AcrR family transcriptional regulator
MGQRDDLLAGAKKCLAEKGYAHTTARDITAASGANLAAIGYHFGSKDALLVAAVIDAFDEWGDLVEAAMSTAESGGPLDRFTLFLEGLLGGAPDRRATIVASVQAFAQAEFAPLVRSELASVYDRARRDLVAMLLDIDPDDATAADLDIGTLVLAVINGMMLQWLVAPDVVPRAPMVAAAIRALAADRQHRA